MILQDSVDEAVVVAVVQQPRREPELYGTVVRGVEEPWQDRPRRGTPYVTVV
jgi:hypothetical protein